MAKKSPPKKARRKPRISENTKSYLVQESTLESNANTPWYKTSQFIVLAAVATLALLGLLFYLKSLFIAATVNNMPIFRMSIIKELEKQGGKQTLNTLVLKTLIFQEAKKKNVSVNKEEIDTELKKAEANIVASGQTLDQVLAAQGLTREGVREQIEIEKLIEKLLGSDITVSDKELTDYIAKNRDTLPQSTDEAQLKESVKQQLTQQKKSEKYQGWLAELQKNAKINYFVSY